MYTKEKKEKRLTEKREYGGILDYKMIKEYPIEDKVKKETRNFEKAQLKAYLKGYKYFKFHGNIFEVRLGSDANKK